ncbi:TrmB family transcriptional regulator [Candidatus Woesearchaeota archaeon]|nr:TrmB family transcriptional regulator [Candidatus Woesearchaeota archaeon]
MDIEKVLQDVGMSGNEIKVYLSLLELGSALAGEITKKSFVNRTNVYDALERLTEKGLVSFVIKSNRKYFEASDPKSIIRHLDGREKDLKNKKEQILAILPELESKRKLNKEPQDAIVYKGKEGIKTIAEEILDNKKEFLVFGAEGQFVDIMKHYAMQWHERRAELRILLRIIYNEKIRNKRQNAGFKCTKMRFNEHLYETPATTWIFNDKVAIIVWTEQPIATLIRSKEVANSYKQFFEILWENSKL